MGNGFRQGFAPLSCGKATFWYNVRNGEVVGNFISSLTNTLVDKKSVLQPVANAPNTFQLFTTIRKNVNGLAFETVDSFGIIPERHYRIMLADVEACPVPPPIKDLSGYVTCAVAGCPPIDFQHDPVSPVETIRIVNSSNMTVEGPVHLLLEGLSQGRAVVNPSGDYLGTPFVDLKSRSLAPGETEDVTIRFNADSTGSVPTFRLRFVSGDF